MFSPFKENETRNGAVRTGLKKGSGTSMRNVYQSLQTEGGLKKTNPDLERGKGLQPEEGPAPYYVCGLKEDPKKGHKREV